MANENTNVDDDKKLEEETTETTTTNEDDKGGEKFKAPEGWMSPEEAQRVRKALETANEEAKNRRLKLKEYEELGLDDLEKAKSILKEREEAELRAAEESKNFSEWQEKIQTRHKTELEKYQQRLQEIEESANTYKTQLETVEREYLVKNEAMRNMQELDAIPEFIMPYLEKEVSVTQSDNGTKQAVIVDEYGEPRLKDGKPMNIRQRLEEMREDPIFGRAFGAPKNSGSGGNNASGSQSTGKKSVPKVTKKELRENPSKLEAFIAEHSMEVYKGLKPF